MFINQFLESVDWVSDRVGLTVPPVVEIDRLRGLPKGSLGRELVEFLNREDLAPLTTGPRRKQLHDAVHVLTGYGTDPIGEAEVQAFLLGAKFHPIQILLGSSLVMMGVTRGTIDLGRLGLAYQRGQRSGFDIDRWEPDWSMAVTMMRVQFRIRELD